MKTTTSPRSSCVLRVLLSSIVLVLWLNNTAVIAQDKFLWTGTPNQPTSWTNPENWQNHLAPKPGSAVVIEQQAPNQVLVITDVPASISLSQLQLKLVSGSNFTVVLQPEKAGSNFVLGNDTKQSNALDIPAGATLVLQGAKDARFTIKSGFQATVAGTLRFEADAEGNFQQLAAGHAGAIVFKAGSICEAGSKATVSNNSPFGASVANAMVFEANSTLIHYSGKSIFGSATQQVVNFLPGSTYEYAALDETASPDLSGRRLQNFVLNTPATVPVNLLANTQIADIQIKQGQLLLSRNTNGIAQVAISGNISLNAGSNSNLVVRPATGRVHLVFAASNKVQDIRGEGNILLDNRSGLIVENGAMVNLGTPVVVEDNIINTGSNSGTDATFGSVEVLAGGRLNVLGENTITGSGRFTLNAGAILGIGSAEGIYREKTTHFRQPEMTKGNIRCGNLDTRLYNAAAHYIYMGTQNQETGTGLPVNSNWDGSLAGRPRLTIDMASPELEVMLTRTVRTGVFNLEKGTLNNRNKTITYAIQIIGSAGNGSPVAGELNISASGILKPQATIFEMHGPVNVRVAGETNFQDVHLLATPTWAAGSSFVDFGTTGKPVIYGRLFIHPGAVIVNNAPFYGRGGLGESTLIYQVAASINRGLEWSSTEGRGFPHHIELRNRTNFNGSGNSVLKNSGNVVINLGSVFNASPVSAKLVSGGNIDIRGTLNGSADVNGNIFIATSGVINLDSVQGNVLSANNLTIEGRLTANANSVITVSGNWLRDRLTGRFESRGSQVVFAGGNASLDLRNNFENAHAEYFDRVVLSKSLPDAVLQSRTPVIIGRKLDLYIGRFQTSAVTLLTIANAGSDSETDGITLKQFSNQEVKAMIEGPVKRLTQANGSYIFPVGIWHNGQALYKACYLTDVNAADSFLVAYNAAVPPGRGANNAYGFFQDRLMGIRNNEYWQIDRMGQTAAAKVVLPYTVPATPNAWLALDGGAITPENPDQVEVWVVKGKQGGQVWDFAGEYGAQQNNESISPQVASLTRGYNNGGFITSGLLNEFSPFTFGFAFYRSLPVTLVKFSAAAQLIDAVLDWKITGFDDLRQTKVQYSRDGRNFTDLNTLNSTRPQFQFTFRHNNPGNGKHFYRIVLFDKAGKVIYSRTQLVQIGQIITHIDGLLQNPVVGNRAIVLMQSASNQMVHMQLADIQGRILQNNKQLITAGNSQVLLQLQAVTKGQYYLIVRTDDGVMKSLPVSFY